LRPLLSEQKQHVSRARPQRKDCGSQSQAERKAVKYAIIFAVKHFNLLIKPVIESWLLAPVIPAICIGIRNAKPAAACK
jgi:hypothetical protein